MSHIKSVPPRLTVLTLLCLSFSIASAQKRPITAKDFDSWKTITGQVLSHDGHYLAYGLFPLEGDGEVVIRNLATGKETRENAGELPPATRSRPQRRRTTRSPQHPALLHQRLQNPRLPRLPHPRRHPESQNRKNRKEESPARRTRHRRSRLLQIHPRPRHQKLPAPQKRRRLRSLSQIPRPATRLQTRRQKTHRTRSHPRSHHPPQQTHANPSSAPNSPSSN